MISKHFLLGLLPLQISLNFLTKTFSVSYSVVYSVSKLIFSSIRCQFEHITFPANFIVSIFIYTSFNMKTFLLRQREQHFSYFHARSHFLKACKRCILKYFDCLIFHGSKFDFMTFFQGFLQGVNFVVIFHLPS